MVLGVVILYCGAGVITVFCGAGGREIVLLEGHVIVLWCWGS